MAARSTELIRHVTQQPWLFFTSKNLLLWRSLRTPSASGRHFPTFVSDIRSPADVLLDLIVSLVSITTTLQLAISKNGPSGELK